MSEGFKNHREQGAGTSADNATMSAQVPHIQVDVPLGTSLEEIQESIFRQVYEFTGTHLRAAIALGITPETVSRVFRRSDRKRRTASAATLRTARDRDYPVVRQQDGHNATSQKPRELRSRAIGSIKEDLQSGASLSSSRRERPPSEASNQDEFIADD